MCPPSKALPPAPAPAPPPPPEPSGTVLVGVGSISGTQHTVNITTITSPPNPDEARQPKGAPSVAEPPRRDGVTRFRCEAIRRAAALALRNWEEVQA